MNELAIQLEKIFWNKKLINYLLFLSAKYFKLAEEAQCTFPLCFVALSSKRFFEHGATENKIHFYRSNDVTWTLLLHMLPKLCYSSTQKKYYLYTLVLTLKYSW